MAKSKTSRAGLAKKQSFKFRWWMALVLVLVVGGAGLIILNFSHASSVKNIYADKIVDLEPNCPLYQGIGGEVKLSSSGRWCYYGQYQSGMTRYRRDDGQCAFFRDGANQYKGNYFTNSSMPGVKYSWITVFETTSCSV